MMKRHLMIILGVLTLLVGAAVQAHATVVSSNADVSITQESVKFLKFGNFVGQATLAEKQFDNLDPIITTISYSSTDYDIANNATFGNAFRWLESITNNSGIAWKGYQLTISDTNGIFLEAPTFVAGFNVPDQAVFGDDSGMTTVDTIGNPPTISADKRTLTFDFSSNPIPQGGILQMHVPIAQLTDDAGSGSFVLTQQPSPVPEPGTLLLIGSGLVGIGIGARRRRRK